MYAQLLAIAAAAAAAAVFLPPFQRAFFGRARHALSPWRLIQLAGRPVGTSIAAALLICLYLFTGRPADGDYPPGRKVCLHKFNRFLIPFDERQIYKEEERGAVIQSAE